MIDETTETTVIAVVEDGDDVEKIKEALEQLEEMRRQQLDGLSKAIEGYLEEAIRGRTASGIEDIWDEDEDAYSGIDDANRDEDVTGRKHEKVTLENAFNSRNRPKKIKSTVFLNITRPYVDAAAARTGDMLLPSDDRSWAFKATPIPEMAKRASEGEFGEQTKALSDSITQEVNARLKKAEAQVDDWLIESDYTFEVRKLIDDCAKVGTGVIKGPFPERVKTVSGYEIKPASRRVDYRNLYPDPNCGEDIQNGKFLFEKDSLTVKKVKELMQAPGYMQEALAEVLKEGPAKRLVDDDSEIPLQDSEVYEVWYFYGLIDKSDLEACECDVDSEEGTIPAMATMINGHIIHVNQYPVDSEDFPYDVITWQARQDHWAGIGIARQIRTSQRMLNAGTRNMMDNAGISSGPQIVYRKDIIRPEDGNYELTPNKRWIAEDDADIQSVANAFIAINIPSLQGPLLEIIQFALKMAEDTSGLPMLMQGNQGQAPDTVGGMTLLNNNANTVLRRVARSFDSNITIPHVKRYYSWLITHHNAQGDYQIEARGSSTLVERDIQNQAIIQMGSMVLNPAFGVEPALWMKEYLRSMKFDPKRFKQEESEDKADPEKEQMVQTMQQMAGELESKQAEMEYKYAELQQEREIALMRLAMDRDMKLEDLKSKLGIEQLKMQKDNARSQQDITFKAIDGKIKVHEAETHRMREVNKNNELKYKVTTGNQGI